jgi:hypothetical protein
MYTPGTYPFVHDAVIGPGMLSSVAMEMAAGRVSQQAVTAAWPAAALAIFVPFWIGRAVTIRQLGWINGTPVASSVDCGIYKPDGTRIISTGNTVASGANAIQRVDVTDTVLPAGNYYIAGAGLLTTVQMFRWAPLAPICSALGVMQMASASPLPSTATMVHSNTLAYIPHVFAQTRAVL